MFLETYCMCNNLENIERFDCVKKVEKNINNYTGCPKKWNEGSTIWLYISVLIDLKSKSYINNKIFRIDKQIYNINLSHIRRNHRTF